MSIGLQVTIIKSVEDDSTVEYRFFVASGNGGFVLPAATGHSGTVRLRKSTGACEFVATNADDPTGLLNARVAFKLAQHWKQREYPERTSWAG